MKRIRRGTVLGFTLFEGKGLMEKQIVGLRARRRNQAVTMPHVSMKEVEEVRLNRTIDATSADTTTPTHTIKVSNH